MNLVVDTHTHTYASGHAYSTLIENARSAKENGLQMFCTTDHAESMPGAPHFWFFSNQRVLPRFIEGVAIIRGVEANILNTQGEIDVNPTSYKSLDWIIASFHEPVFRPSDKATHTEALIKTIESGNVDALGHLGNPNFDFDYQQVLRSAKENNVAIEINNTTLKGNSRVGSVERCYEIAKLGNEIGVYFTTGSDAHFCQDVGELSKASTLFDTVGVSSDKVITHNVKQFLDFLSLRGHDPIPEYQNL
ncbi:hydrolase [Vibrio galatheae]|uniref:Hydrolase n=1 Tax=Vibrio galatheae TaxID=579748 RepID=A0A0F4NL17_9VIBR|nr:phosphatase [Vibrio galatheae]KJY83885.1 hydrolase [Vibrio galatheae]